MNDIELIDSQHHVILNMPCACTLRWIKDGSEREVVNQCSRCRAIAEYQRWIKIPENADV
jgi:hypothetical protein